MMLVSYQQEALISLHEPVQLQAEARLQQSPHVSRCRISCMFHEGVLVLRGRVPSYYAKQIAQTVLRSLDGVLRIDNQLDVAFAVSSGSGTQEETPESAFQAAWPHENYYL